MEQHGQSVCGFLVATLVAMAVHLELRGTSVQTAYITLHFLDFREIVEL